MWYGTGTIQVASNGTTATGTGTQFIGNVRVGDGIAIQGSASLHEVTGVTSNTQLTFSPPYAGTAGSGKAFRVVPVLGYDKDLSDAFNALRLQFGDQLSNLQPWATAPTLDAAQTAFGMSASGKAVAMGTPAQGRTALGLGTAVTRDVVSSRKDGTTGRLLAVGSGGLMSTGTPETMEGYDSTTACSFISSSSSAANPFGIFGTTLVMSYLADYAVQIHAGLAASGTLLVRWRRAGEWGNPATILHTANTTVDSNGFIKSASPILKLHSDRVETEIEAPHFERIDTGHYQLSNTNGLRLDDGWYIETPHDRNKNPYFNVEWEQDHTPTADAGVLEEPADVTLTIRCYERVWNPQTGTYDNGDPVDIPDGRWIDLRMNEVRQPEPEEMAEEPEAPQQPTEPAEPVIPSVVTMAQAKLALLYAGLYEQVEQALADLPEPQKTAALIEWNHRQTLEREHPLVAQVAAALGLTEQQLDDLFVDAAGR